MRVILLLNLAVLVVNYFVSLGATETQVRMVRTTARAAYGNPIPPAAAARGRAREDAPRVPEVRFVKYLGRLERLPDLTPRQLEAVCLALEYCCDELARGGTALRRRPPDGAKARRFLGDLRARVRRNVESTLKAADLADGELLARLVRLVVASAG